MSKSVGALIVQIVRFLIELLPARKTLAPPTSTEAITYSQLHELLSDRFPDAGIYLSDKLYRLCNLQDINRFLEQDTTNKMGYVGDLYDCEVPLEVAYGLGLFFADGSCGLRKPRKYGGAYWRIVGWKKDCLERAAGAFNKEWQAMDFHLRLYDDYKAGSVTNYGERKKDLFCLDVGVRKRHNDSSRGKFIEKFYHTCYFDNGGKKVPAGILESSLETKRQFLQGVIDGDGTNKPYGNCISVHGKAQLAEVIDLMMDVRWKYSISKDNGNDNYRLHFNRRQEGKGKILEFLDGKGFVPAKLIHSATGVSRDSCSRWLGELADGGFLELRKPWSQRLEARLIAPYNFCDDFSYRLMGQFSIRGWSDLCFGIVWTYYHALNCVVAENGEVYFIEPQSDELLEPTDDLRLIII